ncbi:MAG: dihydroorotate dehydrogenase electron transfer subunit [Thermoplasmatales archaeon]|nr:MAG: dihydroorotate dehydrogenase electron transfer subunit [Thermoplasmatales archaeon]
MNCPKITKIIESKKETPDIKTFNFEYAEKTIPGQFFMIWVPGIDEIPMSVSHIDEDIKGITLKRIGDATNALFNLKKGDMIGVRGPYGNGFNIKGKKIFLVGGGTGIAMLAPVVEEVSNKNVSLSVILGVKSKNELFFKNRFKKDGARVYVTTEDGSEGYKGLATDFAKEILKKENFNSILTCGPETMMKKLLDLSGGIYFQASLERYIKCGIGICGQCCVGKGLRVCKEGSVFEGETLKDVEEFGVYKRDAAGRKVKF